MEVTDKLIKEMPAVQENAIDQLAGEQVSDSVESTTRREQEHTGLFDRMGRSFNRALHLVDDDDKPRMTKGGKLKIKRGQGPDASKEKESKIGGLEAPTGIAFAEGQAAAEAEILVTGQSAASLTFLLGIMAFKEDGKPTQDEINQVTYAYQTYFRAKNIRDLPPGIVLATALITYAAPRLMKPKTSKKIAGVWEKIKKRYAKKNRTPHVPGAASNEVETSDVDKG